MQAILITSYKDQENLLRLINKLGNSFNIYIHIDKKSKQIHESEFKKYNNIYVVKKYRITWGSYNHIRAIIHLATKALNNKENNYFHIISGQDYLIMPTEQLKKQFNNCKDIYMNVTSRKEMSTNILNRFKKGTFNASISPKSKITKIIDPIYRFLRQKDGIGEFKKIYKGVIWSSMPREALQYTLDYYLSNKSFKKDLKHCIIPEEFLFQTILMNSKFKENIINDDRRYTDWSNRNGSKPAYLDMSDYKKIISTKDVWIRKVDSTISKELLNKIDRIEKGKEV